MTVIIESFSDLVQMALTETDPPQLLTVLVKAESVHQSDEDGQARPLAGEGVLKPISVKSWNVTPELAFEQLEAEAAELDDRWTFMMLAILPGHDAKPPTPGDIDNHLKHMAHAVLTGGDLSRYLFVDRHGQLVQVSAATETSAPEQTIN